MEFSPAEQAVLRFVGHWALFGFRPESVGGPKHYRVRRLSATMALAALLFYALVAFAVVAAGSFVGATLALQVYHGDTSVSLDGFVRRFNNDTR